MADDSQEFRIHIVSDADNSGFKSAAGASADLTEATRKQGGATEELGESEKKGATLAELLHHNHRALHGILHLLAKESSPAAGAALAGIGAVGGGGVMIGVQAVNLLVEALHQSAEEAAKVKEAARESFVEVVKDATEADKTVNTAKLSIEKFWEALDRKTAAQGVKTAFEATLQQFKDLAKAAEESGLVGKADAAEYVRRNEQAVKMRRAVNLDGSVGSLTDQLKSLEEITTGEAAKKREEELLALKNDQSKLQEAFKKGELFRPQSVAKDSIGILTAGDGEERKQNFATMNAELQRQIEAREEINRVTAEHLKLVQDTIAAMTAESQTLKGDVDKGRSEDAVRDFARGKSFADRFARGESLSQGESQYLIVLEQSITGHKLTLQQAVALIIAQSKNIETAQRLLEIHHGQIAAVDKRLTDLLRQGHSTATIGQR